MMDVDREQPDDLPPAQPGRLKQLLERLRTSPGILAQPGRLKRLLERLRTSPDTPARLGRALLQGLRPQPETLTGVVRALGIAALYAVLGCAVLWPVPLELETRVVGGGELGGWLWRYWLMKLELASLQVELAGHPLQFFLQMISLGRFPETGNVADLYFISWPLDAIFGHPAYYNLKCLLILVFNGLAGYPLARHFTERRLLAFTGGLVAGFNSFVFLELYESGLRQAILWWLLLSILYLERVIERGRLRDAVLGGICFGLTNGFYWFYGIFLAMYSVARAIAALRPVWRSEHRGRILVSSGALVVMAGALSYVFAYPYLYIKTDHTGQLPEVQWFTPFPSLEVLQHAPEFPTTLAENLLSSQARALVSSWSLDYLWNPMHPRAVPIVLTLMALGLGLVRIRREGFWLLIAWFFWLHTGGPYLQHAFHAGERSFVMLGDTPVKLPYAYTFQYVPMMSRLFAPYRSAAMLWIALAVLLVRNLEGVSRRLAGHPAVYRGLLAAFLGLYLGQYFLDDRIVGWLGGEGVGLSGRGLPVDNSIMKVPPFYEALAKESDRIGVIELPLRVQQDLINYYQVVHQKKLFHGWAVPGALPPALRYRQRSEHPETRHLMWIVEPDTPMKNSFGDALEQLNSSPYVLGEYDLADREEVAKRGFKYAILHERGCYMVLPQRGADLYEALKRRLGKHFGESHEFVELIAPEDPEAGKIQAGMLGEWASSAVPGNAGHITRFRMTVYRIPGFVPPSGP
jgi:hypothetical protein